MQQGGHSVLPVGPNEPLPDRTAGTYTPLGGLTSGSTKPSAATLLHGPDTSSTSDGYRSL